MNSRINCFRSLAFGSKKTTRWTAFAMPQTNASAYGGVALGDAKDTDSFKYFTYPAKPAFTVWQPPLTDTSARLAPMHNHPRVHTRASILIGNDHRSDGVPMMTGSTVLGTRYAGGACCAARAQKPHVQGAHSRALGAPQGPENEQRVRLSDSRTAPFLCCLSYLHKDTTVFVFGQARDSTHVCTRGEL